MNKDALKIWFLAARPKTLPAGIAPVVIGTAMAIEDGAFHLPSAFCALLGSILIQIGTNYANDYFDFVKGTDTAERLGPPRATQQGWVTPRQMLMAALVTFSLAFTVGLYLIYRGGLPILAIGLLSILCGVLYTGGPYPLGYLGLGEVFVLIFFGPVALAGTYYVQAQQMYWAPIVAGLAPGLFSVAILTVNNLRDVNGDRGSGKKTLAVRFGVSFARCEYVASIVIASICVPWYLVWGTADHSTVLLTTFVPLAGIPSMIHVFKYSGPPLNRTLASTGQLLLLYTLLFSIGWIL